MLEPLLERYENHLVLDAGGWSQRHGTQRVLATQVHFEGMRQLGLQVANVAGRDLTLGPEALHAFEEELDLQFLSANTYVAGKLRFAPYVLLQKRIDGRVVRIGITGVTSPSQAAIEEWPADSILEFTDPLDAARSMLETLRPQTDIRILLAHLPLASLEEFARDEPLGYDLLISSTGELRDTTPVGPTPVVLAPGTSLKQLAWVYVRAERLGHNEITGGEVLSLDTKIADEPHMQAQVEAFKDRLAQDRATHAEASGSESPAAASGSEPPDEALPATTAGAAPPP